MKNSDAVWGHVETKREAFVTLCDDVWDALETNYAEFAAAKAHAARLEAEVFRLARGISG